MEEDENLEQKVINLAKEHLEVDLKPEKIEIVHRVGAVQRHTSTAAGNLKSRAIIPKFVSNKSKMKLVTDLTRRRNMKGKRIAITENMASEIAKRQKN